MSYEKTGLGREPYFTRSNEKCPEGEVLVPHLNMCVLKSLKEQSAFVTPPEQKLKTTPGTCPAGQTRAFATDLCRPICNTYQCPPGKTRVNHAHVNVGTAAQASMKNRQALIARGCTAAPCSNGPQLIDGSSSIIPYCCPSRTEQPASVVTAPRPETLIISAPPPDALVTTTTSRPSRTSQRLSELIMVSQLVVFNPLFLLGVAGIGGIALFMWWNKRSR